MPDFQEMSRLAWAQEAAGSNPCAPIEVIPRVFIHAGYNHCSGGAAKPKADSHKAEFSRLGKALSRKDDLWDELTSKLAG